MFHKMNMMSHKSNPDSLPRLFLKTRPYRVWSFLTLHPDEPSYGTQISQATGVSRGATSQILNELLAQGLVTRERRGKMWLYLPKASPMVEHFRVFENAIVLASLTSELAKVSKRVILFGSAAQGTDTAESDIDLFVISDSPSEASAAIRMFNSERKIAPVIQTPAEYASARTADKVFVDEVNKGLVLFERGIDEQRL
jgi:predicted nucleotidyltransferase